ncbi:MAG: hypothetical protein AVDCRST_MAG45-1388, partial [uncultured Solirubrobacterales bacterium]
GSGRRPLPRSAVRIQARGRAAGRWARGDPLRGRDERASRGCRGARARPRGRGPRRRHARRVDASRRRAQGDRHARVLSPRRAGDPRAGRGGGDRPRRAALAHGARDGGAGGAAGGSGLGRL